MNIPGFDTISKIAESRSGTVWKAKQVSLNRLVAIKVLNQEFSSDQEKIGNFVQHARVAAQLKHPNIISVYNVAENNGQYCLIMEYVEGKTAAGILAENKRIPPLQAAKIALAIADALRDAWNTQNITHQNLNPRSIMIDAGGNIKLADIGLVGTNTSLDSGTRNPEFAYYMSPEQATGGTEIDFRSDMYSLGALLYHMITGSPPFQGYSGSEIPEKHVNAHIPSPKEIVPSTPVGVVQLMTKLMMKDPNARYKSWEDAISDIDKARKGRALLIKQTQPASACTIKAPQPSGTDKYKHRRIPKTEEHDVSPAIRIPAWIILMIWFVLLGRHSIKNSTETPTEQSASIETNEVSPASPPAVTPPDKTPEVQAADRASDEIDQTPLQDTAEADVPSQDHARDTTSSPPIQAPVVDVDALINEFKMSIIGHILNADFPMVKAIIDRELEYSHPEKFEIEIGKLRDVIGKISEMENIILAAFRAKTGRKVTITHKNRPVEILIRSVSPDRINAEFTTVINGGEVKKPLTFSVSQLDPAEQLKWIEPVNTPEKYAMKYIIHYKAGDTTTARDIAAKCGPLHELFLKAAE